jgi:hypothetical protein
VEAVHDDGIAVWVDGRMVFSKYVASTAHFRRCDGHVGGQRGSSFAIDPSAFVAGENVVAVMIKQANATSSDISFDFKLTTPVP